MAEGPQQYQAQEILNRIFDPATNSLNVAGGDIADDAVTGAKIADDAVDSEHYADGSIDTAHIGDLQVTTAKIAADAITAAKIADNAIDSEHYTDGSIDNAHIADNAVDTAEIADNAITLAKMAGIAAGKIIYGDASGDPAVLAAGSNDQVLTLASGLPSWATPTTGGITSVTAGVGLSGSNTSGDATITLDISELSTVTPADGDSFATLDSDGSNEQKTTTTALATLLAGTGLTASASVIGVDAAQTQITSVGTIGTGVWQGTAIASGYIAADAITGAKIADDAINSEHYTDASVDFAHIQNVAANSILGRNANSSGVLSEVALTTTQILIGDGTGFTAAALSGDATMTNAGVVSLAAAQTNIKTITLPDEGQLIFSDDAPSTDDTATGEVWTMTALTGIAVGELVHIDVNGKLDEAHADSTADMPAIGIALTANSSGSDAEINILTRGVYRDDGQFAFTPGLAVYVSAGTEGQFTQTAPSSDGNFVQRVGIALTADSIWFNPSLDVIEHA